MTALARALGTLLAVALTAWIAWFSRLPYVAESGDEARIRLSWRAVGERVEECREPSEEELAALPRHMHMREICEGRLTPFQLSIELDGDPLFEGRILPSGAREDRPTYVLQEFRVPPGEHHLRVRFAVERPDGSGASRRAPLILDRHIRLAPREIALVTHDADADRLTLFEPPDRR